MTGDLLDAMAGDLGVSRMRNEGNARFACRVSYTALRFWMQAFCLDDGFGGGYGVSKSTITRKCVAWLRNLSGLYPDVLDWYGHGDGMRGNLSGMVRTLAVARDLINTSDGLYRCTVRHTVPLGDDRALLLGLTDPTNLPEGTLPISGMACVTGEKPSDPVTVFNDGPRRPSTRKAVIMPTPDEQYITIDLSPPPSGSSHAAWLDLLTWPVSSVDDQSHRFARTEYCPMLAKLLESSGYAIVSRD